MCIAFHYHLIYNRTTMANPVTNIRLDPKLKAMVLKRAKEAGLTLSEVAKFLFRAYAENRLDIGVYHKSFEYPQSFLDELEKETKETTHLHKEGKLKLYDTADKLFDDILDEK